jgi:hypothetical protein
MGFANSANFGGDLCRALGMSDDEMRKTRSIRIDMEAGEAAEVTVRWLLRESEGEHLNEVLREYNLVPIDETEESAA